MKKLKSWEVEDLVPKKMKNKFEDDTERNF